MTDKPIYVVTPTGDRPESFSLCVKYMNRQTVKPDKWIIVDDGTVDTASAEDANITIPHEIIRLPPISGHSLCRNLTEAIQTLPDGVSMCVVEDDDWYPPNYVEEMRRLLTSSDYVTLHTFNAYSVSTRQYRILTNDDSGSQAAMHASGFSGPAIGELLRMIKETGSWKVDTAFSLGWKGSRAYNDNASPVHIVGLGNGRAGTTSSHRISNKAGSAWEKDPECRKLVDWIGVDDARGYVTDDRKVYIFSNVAYPEERKILPNPDDLLVFLNTAKSLDYYATHDNKVVYHRTPNGSYGDERLCVRNRYVFDAGELSIPKGPLDNLKKEYDWDYPIEAGSVKSATTGYMVTKYMEYAYPLREIVLVNFGFSVAKSTYRCPWHNWIHEDKVLSKFRHIFTADKTETESPELVRSRRRSFCAASELALTKIFTEEGCDQMTRHDYGEVYDRQFARLRGRASKVIVIGTRSTATVRAVKRALPKADVYGIVSTASGDVAGASVVTGDPYDVSTWKDLPYDFDLIIEDGTHRLGDILRGIPVFLYHLADGGSLMIEDIPSEDDVSAITKKLPDAECYRTTPVSNYNDDRVIVYSRGPVHGKLRRKSDYEKELTWVFVEEGSDRMTRHDYGEVYATYFDKLRGKNARVAEIGGFKGSGLRAMKRLLPDAEIYGISPSGVSKMDGVTIIRGDAYGPSVWDGVAGGLDMIIDDGSHRSSDIVRGIPVFLSKLNAGGVLLIEDIPSEEAVSEIVAHLPGSVCYRTTPVSEYNDDRVIVYVNLVSDDAVPIADNLGM